VLLQHYWVVIKFLMTVFATIVLVLHMRPVGIVADEAPTAALTAAELGGLRLQLLADAVGAIVLLLVAAILSVLKPPGRTRTAGGCAGAAPGRSATAVAPTSAFAYDL